MQLRVHGDDVTEQARGTVSVLTPTHPETSSSHFFAFEMNATVPPATDPRSIMQHAEEVDTIQALLSGAHTSAVMLVGEPGVGKSTLAALLYERLLLIKRRGEQHLITWYGYASIPIPLSLI